MERKPMASERLWTMREYGSMGVWAGEGGLSVGRGGLSVGYALYSIYPSITTILSVLFVSHDHSELVIIDLLEVTMVWLSGGSPYIYI